MRIPIEIHGKTYLLTSDEDQFIIGEERIDSKKGTVRIGNPAYFSTIGAAFNHLLEVGLRGSGATTLQELVDDFNEFKDFLLDVFSGIKPRRFSK